MRVIFLLLMAGLLNPVTGWTRTVDVSLTCDTGGTCNSDTFTLSYTEIDPCVTGTLSITSTALTLSNSSKPNNGTYPLNPSPASATITSPSCNLGGTLTYKNGGTVTINLATRRFSVGSGANAQAGAVNLTIPEPGTLALLLSGLGVLLVRERWTAKASWASESVACAL